MPPKDVPVEVESPVLPIVGPKMLVSVGVACAVGLAILMGVLKFNTWATQVDGKLGVMQTAIDKLAASVTSLERLSRVEERFDAKFEELRKYGSDNAKATAQELLKLREDFNMHVATHPTK